MKPFSTVFFCASFSFAVLFMGCAERHTGATPGTGPGSSLPSNGPIEKPNTGPNRVSSGTQGDTLEACLSRIPSDASESQRMLATLTCERDARARSSIDAVPGK